MPTSQPSGPNHHFLPRLLQRGFASGKKGKNPLVFYFHRAGLARELQITGVGADEYFYGHPSESSVDEQLKVQENQFGAVLFELRSVKVTQPISEALMPALLAHMALRTKNLRDGFVSAAERLMERLASPSDNPEGKVRLQRRMQTIAAAEVEKMLGEEPCRSALATLDLQSRSLLVAHVQSQLQNIDLAAAFGPAVRELTAMLNFSQAARNGHIRALANLDDAVPPRIESLKLLKWSLIVQPRGTFILGDIAVMARHRSDGPVESPFKENETPHEIFLPISDRHLLVGSRDKFSGDVDSESINCASAELSVDFFIASQNTDREHRYLSRLGKRTGLLTADELESIFRGIEKGEMLIDFSS